MGPKDKVKLQWSGPRRRSGRINGPGGVLNNGLWVSCMADGGQFHIVEPAQVGAQCRGITKLLVELATQEEYLNASAHGPWPPPGILEFWTSLGTCRPIFCFWSSMSHQHGGTPVGLCISPPPSTYRDSPTAVLW